MTCVPQNPDDCFESHRRYIFVSRVASKAAQATALKAYLDQSSPPPGIRDIFDVERLLDCEYWESVEFGTIRLDPFVGHSVPK